MKEILYSFFGPNFLNPEPHILAACFKVIGLGLAGVFTVLILFFFITKFMVYIAGKLDKSGA